MWRAMRTKVGVATALGASASSAPEAEDTPPRVILSRRGFCNLREQDQTRQYASVEQVHQVLAHVASGPAPSGAIARAAHEALKGPSVQHAEALRTIGAKLRDGKMQEAEAARQTMMLIGSHIHFAISLATTPSADKLTRARRASQQRASVAAPRVGAAAPPKPDDNQGEQSGRCRPEPLPPNPNPNPTASRS